MPMHDWTKVTAAYHAFRFLWVASLMDRLNAGGLPRGWFALAARAGRSVSRDAFGRTADAATPAGRARQAWGTTRLAIHRGLDNVVAVLEIVSPGNKDTKHALRSFARESARLLYQGVHLSVIDPFPPGRHDPRGVHRAIWDNVTLDSAFVPPPGKPLAVVGYQAGEVPTAYVEPFAAGEALPDLPLFLDEEYHVMVPLERTYQATWGVLPVELRELFGTPAT